MDKQPTAADQMQIDQWWLSTQLPSNDAYQAATSKLEDSVNTLLQQAIDEVRGWMIESGATDVMELNVAHEDLGQAAWKIWFCWRYHWMLASGVPKENAKKSNGVANELAERLRQQIDRICGDDVANDLRDGAYYQSAKAKADIVADESFFAQVVLAHFATNLLPGAPETLATKYDWICKSWYPQSLEQFAGTGRLEAYLKALRRADQSVSTQPATIGDKKIFRTADLLQPGNEQDDDAAAFEANWRDEEDDPTGGLSLEDDLDLTERAMHEAAAQLRRRLKKNLQPIEAAALIIRVVYDEPVTHLHRFLKDVGEYEKAQKTLYNRCDEVIESCNIICRSVFEEYEVDMRLLAKAMHDALVDIAVSQEQPARILAAWKSKNLAATELSEANQ